MVYPFICSPIQCIHPLSDHEEEDEEDNTSSIDDVQFPPSPEKKQRRKSRLFRRKSRKNPYANRGLDKFSAVLTELQHKRQQIYTQKGSEDISLVHFIFSDSNRITPVVVKGRDKNKTTTTTATAAANNHVKHIQESSSSAVPNLVLQPGSDSGDTRAEESGDHRADNKKKMDIWRPWYYYLPVGVILLIMVFLAMFGKSLAILCTSLVWYLVPTIEARSNSKQKKQYSTTAREKKQMVADDILVGDKNKAVTGRDRESDASSSSSST